MNMKDRVTVVTGSGRGIGAALAHAFAKDGARVVVSDLDAGATAKTAEEIRALGGHAIACACDVTNRASVEKLVADTMSAHGTIDVLVNNAGIIQPAMITKMTDAQWNTVVDVNMKGPFLCMQAVGRVFIEKAKANPEARCNGKVVNISSVAGARGSIGQINYAAAKAGVLGMTMTAAREWGRFRVNVNAVGFGVVETEMTKTIRTDPKFSEQYLEQIALGRFGTTEDVVPTIAFFASSGADYITGQFLIVDGGLHIGI